MVKKHIKRDYSAHKKSVVRPTNEYIKLEIFSFNHVNTETYTYYKNNLTTTNTNKITDYAWVGYESQNQTTRFDINFNYSATINGEFRLDLIYLSKDARDMTGYIQIYKDNEKIQEDLIIFDGEVDILKRQVVFYNLNEGTYTFNIRMPVNTIFLGGIVREIKLFTGDNIDSQDTNLMFTKCTISKSSETKPAEVNCTVAYDDDFECSLSNSSFYMDYHDEMNIYTKDEDGQLKQIFGGYLSSILPDNDRTTLTITGADRLIDGQNKYILNEMFLLGGKSEHEDYMGEDYKDFQKYGEALKYLCDLFEVTLKNNINENFLVGGESYNNAVTCTYGENGNTPLVYSSDVDVETSSNFITVRNRATSDNIQTVLLYSYANTSLNPVNITDYPNFFITYGLGDPKTETDVTSSTSIPTGATGEDVVTQDTITVNQMPSCACCSGTAYKRYTKTWLNYCPHCGQTGVLQDNPKGVYEGEITCSNCDADYCGYCGGDKGSKARCKTYKLTAGSATTAPSKKTSDTSYTPTVSIDDVMALGKNFAYGGNSSSINQDEARTLEKNIWAHDYVSKYHKCDCFGMSAFLFIEFMRAGYRVRVVKYYSPYASSGTHRTVQIWQQDGTWIDPPYTGYNTLFKPMTNKKNMEVLISSEGYGVDGETKTITTKILNGYDKSNPFKGYFQIDYKLEKEGNTFESYLVLDFSQQSHNDSAYGNNDKDFDPIWLNNSIKQATINCNQYIKEDAYKKGFTDAYAEGVEIYLLTIKLKSLSTTEEGTNAPYITNTDGTIDNASCKMDVYACGFNNGTIINPTDLSTCGKNINTEIEALIKSSGYIINMEYSQHRKDDVINFMVDNQTQPKFIAEEGDDNNILSWGNITYTPVTTLFNNSIYVYKKQFKDNAYYKYVNSKDSTSVLKYGEQSSLQTTSEILSDAEAYYYSRVKTDKFNWKPLYTYTLSVVGTPDLDINDLVQVKADAQKLNTIKTVESLKVEYDYSKIPRISTEIGLGELAPDFQLQKLLRELRDIAKQESTLFSGSATKITDSDVYQWER